MTKKVSKLTVKNMQKEKASLAKMKAITVTTSTGATYNLDVYETITNTQIDQTYNDMVEFFKTLLDLDMDLKDKNNAMVAIAPVYLLTCLIGRISSLELPDSVADRVAVAQHFYDLELLDKITEQIDDDQVKKAVAKLEKMLTEYSKGVDKLAEDLEAQMAELNKQEQVIWEVDENIAEVNTFAMEESTIDNIVPFKAQEEN